jgi:hypothetical protein
MTYVLHRVTTRHFNVDRAANHRYGILTSAAAADGNDPSIANAGRSS